MKALSVRQPWANLIADGHKTIETRTWQTSYRGPLLIVSSKTVDEHAMRKLQRELREVVTPGPLGYALAVCTLADCYKMGYDDERAACCEKYAGACAWCLTGIHRVRSFPVRGKPGLFDVDVKLELL